MPYTAPTPSTVAPGDTFPATAYNIIAGDIADHETRIKTGVESYTTAQKTALTGVTTGTVIYDSTLGLVQLWNGTAWVEPNKPPAVQIVRTSFLTSFSSGSVITWQAADWDTDSMYSAGSPTLITIKTAGLYSVSFNARFDASATLTEFTGTLKVNGTNRWAVMSALNASGGNISMTNVFNLAVNDTLSIMAQFSGGSNYSIAGGGATSTDRSRFSATYIGRTT
jgi:hypothetical protein